MSAPGSTLSTTEKLFGTTSLDSRRAEMIRRTYMLLAVAVAAAMGAGWWGSHNETFLKFIFGLPNWLFAIGALVALNAIPMIAYSAARMSPVAAFVALAADGLVAGLVLSPLLFIANMVSASQGTDLVNAALTITAAVFGAISLYIFVSQKQFSAPRGLMVGIIVSVVAAVLVNTIWLQSGLLSILISGAVGIFGTLTLVYATSDVLNNPEYDDPMAGALMLFAGLFNVFQAVLNLLLAFNSRD